MRAEIAFYREHMSSLALDELRRECAQVVAASLGRPVSVEQLLAALVFEPYPDVRSALECWRARGLRLVVVSNWDESLPGTLAGLDLHFDGIVTSAGVGAEKPDPAIVEEALRLAGTRDALLIGDSLEDEVAARAAGIGSVLLRRPHFTLDHVVL